jgi:ADP-heptose:LPS heptosyltransferase
MSARRVLVIGPSNIGDGILVSEVVARVRQAHPKAQLTLVVGERAALLFEDDPRVQQLIVMERYERAARLNLLVKLWRWGPQVVVDLRGTAFPLALKPLSAWRYARRPPEKLTHMHDRHLWKLAAQAPEVARRVPRSRASRAYLEAVGSPGREAVRPFMPWRPQPH